MPQMFLKLAEAKGQRNALEVEQSTGNGVSLEWHWNNQPTRFLISSRGWDHVVLQDRSGGPLESKTSFQQHARLLDGEIKKQGAKTVFYMTWANLSRPQTQKNLTKSYEQMAQELGAILAPVGLAWENAQKADPRFRLHHADGRHANPAGSYLAALVFYSVLFNVSPEGLPGKLPLDDTVLVDLDESRAEFLQRIAYETVKT
jgi:hypothetical protein